MSDFDQARRFADNASEAAADNFKKGQAAAERTMRSAEQNFSASVDTLRDFNVRMIEMARVNTDAAFEFAHNFATARSPTDLYEIWTKFAQKQIETLNRQSHELTALTQTLARDSVKPMQDAASQFTKRS